MKPQTTPLFKRGQKEEAFTLVEVMFAILIIGILAAIAVPAFFRYKAELDSQELKTKLIQAATFVEQDQVDNNGLYPKYIPNEMLSNSTMKGFAYTYSDDRTQFCLQANTPSGKWFVSSESKVPSKDVCTQPNVASNSSTPWKGFTVPVPTFKGQSTNSWASNASASNAQVQWNGITCPLASEDADEWASKTVATYAVRVTNTSRGGTITTPWQTQTTATIPLTNWLPGDAITYQLQARCTITSGSDYNYTSNLSTSQTDTVASFTVNDTTWTTAPAMTWKATDSTPSYKAAWKDAFCPAGTMQYSIDVTQTGATKDSTGNVAWATNITKALNSTFTGGSPATITHKVSCLLSDGRRVTSNGLTATMPVPLKPPVAPASISSDNSNGITPVTPNNILWSAVTCTLGNPEYRLNRAVPDNANSSWITATNLQQSLTAGTTYQFRVESRCNNGSVTSDSSGYSPVLTVTAQYNIPPKPAVPASLRSDDNGSNAIANNHLSWGAVSCDAASYAEYRIQRYMKDGTTTNGSAGPSTWTQNTDINIPGSWLAYGSKLGFQVQSRCTNPNYSSDPTAWSAGHTFTTDIPAPKAPGGIDNNGWFTVSWDATSCPSGTSTEYRIQQYVTNGNNTSTYSGWSTSRSSGLSGATQGKPQGAKAQAHCSGPNADSDPSSFSSNTTWYSGIDAPTGMNAGISSYRTASWGGNCAAGTDIQFIWAIRDSAGNDKWSNYSWSGQTSYSNTSTGWGTGTVVAQGRCYTNWKTSGGAQATGPFG